MMGIKYFVLTFGRMLLYKFKAFNMLRFSSLFKLIQLALNFFTKTQFYCSVEVEDEIIRAKFNV